MKDLKIKILNLPKLEGELLNENTGDWHPSYTEILLNYWDALYETGVIDINAPTPREKYPEIEEKDINELNIEELLLFLDYHFYGERFSTGAIAGIIRNGKLLEADKRLRELASQE
jgi:hypothetical protein